MNKLDITIKLDELLSKRESLKSSLININRLIKQGIEINKGLPDRWYVRNPNEKVYNYLKKKYNRKFTKNENIGHGELHGEYAFVPHDVSYSWEITQDEFDYAISLNGR